MNTEAVIAALQNEFPGGRVIHYAKENLREVAYQLSHPDETNRQKSTAIVIIEQSRPHIHNISREEVTVEDGSIVLLIGGSVCHLEKGQTVVIEPGQMHFIHVKNGCRPARLRVVSTPPWSENDHILA